MKKALIHDWYYVNGGAEKVIKSFNNIWDDFDHFTLVDFLNKSDRQTILKGRTTNTSFIQNLPTARNNHRKFLQLFPTAIEQFNLSQYDLILSSSASVAKGILCNSEQLHICYCHSPMRYAWDLYHEYMKGFKPFGLKSIYAKRVLNKMRIWDVVSSNRVDYFIANSTHVAKRIRKIYNRDAHVIYPPVDVENYTLEQDKEDYYFTASRMVPYKRIDLIIKTFNKLPNKKLIIGGEGPELLKLKKLANSNIEFTGFLSPDKLKFHLQKTKAFLYAAEEDFGIIPVEAQACGTPVIGYKKGGLLETIIHGETGLLFEEQSVECLLNCINEFENMKFNFSKIRDNSLRFSVARFEKEIEYFVNDTYQKFKTEKI